MKTSNLIRLLILLILIVSCSAPASTDQDTIVLFAEGADTWAIEGDAEWNFENQVLVGRSDSTAGFVISKDSFKDFELTLEFNPDSTVNSGVFVRCTGEGISAENCYEINIWDLHPNQDYRTGAVVLKASPLSYVETLNKWNTYKIRCEGDRMQAWVNGEQTVDSEDTDFSEGYIAIQAASVGTIRFRKIEVREL